MNKEDHIPDQVVFDQNKQIYDASLRTFPTNVGAPKIEIHDSVSWKQNNLQKANAHFKTKFQELKQTLDTFMEQYNYNKLLYTIKYNFEPIVGQRYHLYLNNEGAYFLSIIAPNECKFQYQGSFSLNDNLIWVKEE